MQCPNCGKQVPDHSKLCLHCGFVFDNEQMLGDASNNVFSDEPPAFIKDLIFVFHGDTQKSLWGLGSLTRGFAVAFSLIDKIGNYTRLDGVALVTLRNRQPHYTYGIHQYKFLDIKKSDFQRIAVESTSPPFGVRTFWGCWLLHEKSDLHTNVDWGVRLTVSTGWWKKGWVAECDTTILL
jgi:hypothetical protein